MSILPSVFHIIVTQGIQNMWYNGTHTHLGSSDRTDTCIAQTEIIFYIVTDVAPHTVPH
jgi:hypothetical protein